MTINPMEPGGGAPKAALDLQKELLEAYEQASKAWLARVQSEVQLWSDMATRISATKSAPEAIEVYRQCVAQRMQMAADDGHRLMEDAQKITQKITRSLSNGWPSGSS
jgi:hypothetical protein